MKGRKRKHLGEIRDKSSFVLIHVVFPENLNLQKVWTDKKLLFTTLLEVCQYKWYAPWPEVSSQLGSEVSKRGQTDRQTDGHCDLYKLCYLQRGLLPHHYEGERNRDNTIVLWRESSITQGSKTKDNVHFLVCFIVVIVLLWIFE